MSVSSDKQVVDLIFRKSGFNFLGITIFMALMDTMFIGIQYMHLDPAYNPTVAISIVMNGLILVCSLLVVFGLYSIARSSSYKKLASYSVLMNEPTTVTKLVLVENNTQQAHNAKLDPMVNVTVMQGGQAIQRFLVKKKIADRFTGYLQGCNPALQIDRSVNIVRTKVR